AHVEISNMLQRMRELAVQSANDTNTAQDRAKISAETKQLIAEVNRVAETTTFNGMKVLDGSFSGKQFQIGADAGQTITVNVDSASARSIGANTISSSLQIDDAAPTSQNLTITGHAGQETVASGTSAKAAAKAINDVSAATGVTASAVTKAELTSVSSAGIVSFSVNGTSIGNVTITDTTDLTALRDAINDVAGTTGITAEMGETNGSVVLTSATGENISITGYSNGAGATETMVVNALKADGTAPATAVTATLTEGGTVDAVVAGELKLTSTNSFSAVGSAAGFLDTTASTSTLSSVADIDVDTVENSKAAIQVLDAAIEKISESRANLGAISNRLDSTISNLTNISTNVSEAKSQIMDADFAQESTALARAQILSQASTAMLAQANASKQGVLSLLRG
nr:flagellar filament protein [Cypionkella sp.]